MNFTINVQVTGLESIFSLLERLVSVSSPAQQNGGAVNLAQAVDQTMQPVQQMQPVMSLVPPQMQPQLQQQVQLQQPVQQMQVQPQPQMQMATAQTPLATVPTVASTFSMEQLAVAATQLVDAGRRTELVSLLATFGVASLTELPKDYYGAFATQLRGMGARI